MSARDRFMMGLAKQLGRPEGLRGRMLGRGLNRGNRTAVTAAVKATGLQPGQVGADVGFGGGVGLRLLLDAVGPAGHVHGIELSTTMLAAARRRHRAELTAARMTLVGGVLEKLPLADASVDGLITVNTLYFVDDVASTFRELARVLRPSGRAVIGVGDPVAMGHMPMTQHGFRLRPMDEITERLADAGLGVRHEQLGDDSRSFHLLIASHEAR
jgi:SAM-dependent methyltransferase